MLWDKNFCWLFCFLLCAIFHQLWLWRYRFGGPQESANMSNWTDCCTRPRVRVAMEVKLLMGALRATTRELRSQKPPNGPPRGPKWLKMTVEVKKNLRKWAESLIKVRFFANSTVKWYIYFFLHLWYFSAKTSRGWLDESFFSPFSPFTFCHPHFEVV